MRPPRITKNQRRSKMMAKAMMDRTAIGHIIHPPLAIKGNRLFTQSERLNILKIFYHGRMEKSEVGDSEPFLLPAFY